MWPLAIPDTALAAVEARMAAVLDDLGLAKLAISIAVRTLEVPSHPNRGPVAPVGDDVRHPGRSLHLKRLGIIQPGADRRA
jgi:hypothetical protein